MRTAYNVKPGTILIFRHQLPRTHGQGSYQVSVVTHVDGDIGELKHLYERQKGSTYTYYIQDEIVPNYELISDVFVEPEGQEE